MSQIHVLMTQPNVVAHRHDRFLENSMTQNCSAPATNSQNFRICINVVGNDLNLVRMEGGKYASTMAPALMARNGLEGVTW